MTNLKDGEQWLPERIKIAARFLLGRTEVEPSTEQLHSEQSEDDDKQKQEQQQTGDGPYRVQERCDQITQRRPVTVIKNQIYNILAY